MPRGGRADISANLSEECAKSGLVFVEVVAVGVVHALADLCAETQIHVVERCDPRKLAASVIKLAAKECFVGKR